MHGSEHFSRNPRPEWQMRAFREVIEDCSLQDVGWTGVPFTWDNRQAGQANVKSCLDRALENEEFLQRYEHISVRHISTTESDHCLVLAEFRKTLNGVRPRPKQLRYENVCQSHVDYDKIITESWLQNQASNGLQGVVDSLQSLQRDLEPWGAKEFGCLAKKVRKLQQKLYKLRRQSVGRGPSTEEKSIVKQLREALRQEETWMRQSSRVRWLKEGDWDTAYFHAQAAQRKRINKIANLRRLDGSVCVNEEDDKCEVQAFYQNLDTSQGLCDLGELLDFVPEKVTMGVNELLTNPFSSEEVREALFHMAPSKAPGVYGFTAGFSSVI
ncbi:uncharacterized protein [Lolium perenne]|uniref:uncharacterized protein n=1 Tax=Lolium perenne TaxID=4522 RepID=UPI003A99A86B